MTRYWRIIIAIFFSICNWSACLKLNNKNMLLALLKMYKRLKSSSIPFQVSQPTILNFHTFFFLFLILNKIFPKFDHSIASQLLSILAVQWQNLSATPATIIVIFICLFVLVLLFMGRMEPHYLENQTNHIKSHGFYTQINYG